MSNAVAEIAHHGLSIIHGKISNKIKILKDPVPVEVKIAEVIDTNLDDDEGIEGMRAGGEPDVNFIDELTDEAMKEFDVDTEEELGSMLTVESVMKS